jgi:ABC-type nitrate/sulfonate/bicarbonate transport system substrate-binding protein
VKRLSIALGKYGLTCALHDGGIRPDGVDLDFAQVEPITAAMRRMVRTLDFDICEMAFTTYLCAKALGAPIIALPVFLTRNFHHWAAFRTASGKVREPKDLEGRTVAVNRGYTVTTGLWVRGVLQHEYGVDLDRITWAATDEEHVANYKAPANVHYQWRGKQAAELLLSRACEAAIGDAKSDSPEVQPLIANARAAGFDWFRKTGIFPINHGVVVRTDLLDEIPHLAQRLTESFTASKTAYMDRLATDQTPAGKAARANAMIVGDPFPFGIAANRQALEAITRYAVEQRVIPSSYKVEDLFVA